MNWDTPDKDLFASDVSISLFHSNGNRKENSWAGDVTQNGQLSGEKKQTEIATATNWMICYEEPQHLICRISRWKKAVKLKRINFDIVQTPPHRTHSIVSSHHVIKKCFSTWLVSMMNGPKLLLPPHTQTHKNTHILCKRQLRHRNASDFRHINVQIGEKFFRLLRPLSLSLPLE